ncbi:MAG: hypothetical protein WAK33_11330, partial [Silvibacterium sp.]
MRVNTFLRIRIADADELLPLNPDERLLVEEALGFDEPDGVADTRLEALNFEETEDDELKELGFDELDELGKLGLEELEELDELGLDELEELDELGLDELEDDELEELGLEELDELDELDELGLEELEELGFVELELGLPVPEL